MTAPRDTDDSTMKLAYLRQLGPALAVVVASVIAVYVVPGLHSARPWTPGDPVPFWNLLGRPFERVDAPSVEAANEAKELESLVRAVEAEEPPPVAPPRPTSPAPVEPVDPEEPYTPRPEDDVKPVRSVELFKGTELDAFFEQLEQTDRRVEGAITRVVHWGDSSIGLDGIPGAVRRRMQNRFGDAGHGFHLIAPSSTSYRHREVAFRHNDNWNGCSIIMRCRKDGFYGLGAATFYSHGGAESRLAPHPKRSSGLVSRFEVWYAARPGGGNLRIRVDDGEPVYVDTAADALEDRWYAIDLDEDQHELEVRASGGGRVRVFGVTMERPGPGVVWDGLAIVGAFTKRLRNYDSSHLRAQLQHRQANLVVFTFGGNDMIRSSMSMKTYKDEYGEVLTKVRQARPEASCLLMSPLDHGERKGMRIRSKPIVKKMVQAQREAAKAHGCAFFDTWSAMGGEGSAERWYRRKPRFIGGDLSHATRAGHQVVGELLYRALIEAYVNYRQR